MGTFDLLTPEEICHELGQRCRILRLGANLSQRELAARIGTSLSSIRRLESQGQGTLELLVRITQVLQLASHLENLLVLPVFSIADAEQAVRSSERLRATPAHRRKKPA